MKQHTKYKWLIVCHLFYEDEGQKLLDDLLHLNSENSFFLFNIHPANISRAKIEQTIKGYFKHYLILSIPPKGRDIGAKLQLINLALQLEISSEYTLIVHDKKSPHLGNGSVWKNELLKIIRPGQVHKVMEQFAKQPDIGIIGTLSYIQNEYQPEKRSFSCQANKQIKEILSLYEIQPADFSFVAGNIFWIRSELLQSFFKGRSIADIRAQLESGNALDFVHGTYIHAWERIMSWIATSQGYKLYGI